MSSRRQARAGTPRPALSAVPPEFRVGPLVEVWAKVENYDPADVFPLWMIEQFSASHRFKDARSRWTEASGLLPVRRDSRAWSYVTEVGREQSAHYAAKLSDAGISPADFPRLRAAAEIWLR